MLDVELGRLPQRPGVYRFLNAAGETLYVGKAKSLRNRVRSYFQPGVRHSPHIARMVGEVADLNVIVVDTEMEALILEANLIKQERPRFNVVLRDDKSFPLLKVSVKDEYPRAALVRRARLDGSRYIGPFLPASAARRTLKMLQRYFQVATCKEVFDGKRRPCLYYHLDQCLAPCAGKTDPVEYRSAVDDALLFLDGRDRELAKSLDARMRESSKSLEYEKAGRYRDTLRTVRALAVRQRMSSVGLEEQDYWSYHAEGSELALQLFEMRQGRIQSRREFTMDEIEVEAPALFASVLVQFYSENDPPQEVYSPTEAEQSVSIEAWLSQRRGSRVRLRVPQRGPKRKLLELVRKNARLAFEARFRTAQSHGVAALESLAESIGLDEPPYRIECFDISNIQGADSVASMVVWVGGAARKSDYRSYSIKSVRGSDDTASIAEAVSRRYRRLLAEDRRLPDLVLIDGGKGQLGAAVAAATRVGLPMLPIAAIAKREEEIFLPGRSQSVRLPRSAPALHLIQRIRDEAHRFAVSHHRRRRKRRTLRTELTELPGVGAVRARKLLRAFGSLDGVRKASTGELEAVVGRNLAETIRERYDPESEPFRRG